MRLLLDTHTFLWWDSEPEDPFDRLLIVQAIAEDLTLVSKDSAFSNYPVKVVW